MTEPNDAEDRDTSSWEHLYDQVRQLLLQHGREDAFGRGDFWVHDDDWGSQQIKVYLNTLVLLHPEVISGLQRLLKGFAGWEIVVAVAIRGAGETWPDMGLTIRAHEIVDGLQRRYFPAEFRDIRYEGSRPGTERD